uniref:Alpha-2-MRAP_C domain-containing protein n=1 Tax=Trichuris muris TaxID=70415 RepID=A0A5S6QQ05_TRIMR
MGPIMLFTFHLLATCFCKSKFASSAGLNEPVLSLTPEQAQQVIPRLNVLDEAYINLKHEQKIASDVVAVKRKELDQSLAKLLEEVGAPQLAMPLFNDGKKLNLKAEPVTELPTLVASDRLSDKKLNKLWQRAQQAGFSADQLSQLREEFETQDKLVQGYQELTAQLAHTHSNEVMTADRANQTEDDKKTLKLMKEKLSALQTGYQKLLQKVQTQEKEVSMGQFKHARVSELWSQLQAAGLPQSRLAVLNDELRRLDRKVEKLNFLRNELTDSEIQLGKMGKNTLQTPEHRHLARKLDEFERKVSKLEQYIQSQIHSEL